MNFIHTEDRRMLADRLDAWSALLKEFSDEVSRAFLTHTAAPQQLTGMPAPSGR